MNTKVVIRSSRLSGPPREHAAFGVRPVATGRRASGASSPAGVRGRGVTTAARVVIAEAKPPAVAAGGEDGTRRPTGRTRRQPLARHHRTRLATVAAGCEGATTVVAVRVPRALYESVVRDLLGALVEKPSYAQIIAWTCQDHPDEVRVELQRQVTADCSGSERSAYRVGVGPLDTAFSTCRVGGVGRGCRGGRRWFRQGDPNRCGDCRPASRDQSRGQRQRLGKACRFRAVG